MLRASAVLLSGGAAGALATSRISSRAAAAETDLSVTGDAVEVRGEDITAVWLDLAVGWAYSVPSEESPQTVVLEVRIDDSSVTSTERDIPFLEGDGEESFSVDLLAADVLDASALMPESTGSVRETVVSVGAELRVYDTDGFVIAASGDTDSATITIERDDYDPTEYGGLTGSGTLTVELDH